MSRTLPAADILDAAAETFRERSKIYQDNWRRVGAMMAGMFPAGVTLRTEDDFNRFHILMLKIVKLSRYAVAWGDGGHHDSIHDDAVYAAMLEAIDAEIAARPVDLDRAMEEALQAARDAGVSDASASKALAASSLGRDGGTIGDKVQMALDAHADDPASRRPQVPKARHTLIKTRSDDGQA